MNTELREVIKKILPAYEQALVEMPKDGHWEWLRDRDMELGICFYSKNRLGECIYESMKKIIIGHIGCDFPEPYYTYSENLKQIQNRVDWMREYLSKQ